MKQSEAISDAHSVSVSLRVFGTCFVLNVLLFFGMLTSYRLYIDDIGRSIDGYFQWTPLGRPLMDLVIYVLNLGKPLVNTAPLPQLLSLALIAVAGAWLADLYRIRSPLVAALCTLPLAGQPYYLQNMSYSFDAPAMTLSLVLALLAAVMFARSRSSYTPGASIFLLASLLLYQSAVAAYFVAATFIVVKHLVEGGTISRSVRQLLAAGAIALPSLGSYWLISKTITLSPYARTYGAICGPATVLSKAATNLLAYLAILYGDWHATIAGAIFLTLLAASGAASVLAGIRNHAQSRAAATSAVVAGIIILYGIMVVGSYAPMILMERLRFDPRTFMGIGVLLTFSCLQLCSILDGMQLRSERHWLTLVPALVLASALFNVAYAYSRASESQKEFETTLVSAIIQDVETVMVGEKIENISFIGRVPYSSLAANTVRKYPLVGRLVYIHINNNHFWGTYQLKGMGLPLKRILLGERERHEVPVRYNRVVSRYRYTIYQRGDTVVIDLKNPSNEFI